MEVALLRARREARALLKEKMETQAHKVLQRKFGAAAEKEIKARHCCPRTRTGTNEVDGTPWGTASVAPAPSMHTGQKTNTLASRKPRGT